MTHEHDDDMPDPTENPEIEDIVNALKGFSKQAMGKVLGIAEDRFHDLRRDRANAQGRLDPENDDDYNEDLETDINQAVFESIVFVQHAVDLLRIHKKLRPKEYQKNEPPSVRSYPDGTMSVDIPVRRDFKAG